MKAEKARSLKLNIAASMLIQIISLLVNLISKRAIRCYLGVEYLGIQSIYANFCDILSFAFLGMGSAMLFRLYGAFARGSHEEIASYFQYFDQLYRKASKAALAGGVICTLLALYAVNGDAGVFEVCVTYLTYMLSVVLYNRQQVCNYFIQADQRRYVVAFVTGGVDAVALLGEIFILCYFRSYVLFLLCVLIKNILINRILKKYLQTHYAYILQPAKTIGEREKACVLSNVKDMVLYRFGKVMISNTDSIFISRYTGTLLAGIYSNYQFVIYGICSILGALFEAVKGRIGHQVQTRSLEEQYQCFQKYLCLNGWLMGYTIVCFYFLIEDFIHVWMGKVDAVAQTAVILLLVNYYLDESQNIHRVYRETAGLFHNIRTVILVKGMANIVLSMVLGKIWGLLGVLFATTMTSVLTLFWYEPKIVYGYFQRSIWNEVLYHLVTLGLLFASFGLTDLVVGTMEGAGLQFFLWKGCVCLVTSNILYAVLFGIWFMKKRMRYVS